MQIKDLYRQKKPVVSFEIFPPKKDGDIESIYRTLEKLSGLGPDFISVTYGAGGGGSVNKTGEIAAAIKREYATESLAHLTCIAATRDRIRELAEDLRATGVENILAMRGDLPEDGTCALSPSYRYAVDLIRDLKELGGFCIGAAAYPEGHIDCDDFDRSLDHMLLKEEAGADFFITQLFFDNSLFYRFLDKARKKGIKGPVSAGIMPFLSRQQIQKMIFLCGASLPSDIIKLLHRYDHDQDALRQAGIDYAVRQMEDLIRNGVEGVHVYTMNRPSIARQSMEHIGALAPAGT